MHAPLRVPSVIFFTNTHFIADAWGRTLTTSNARAKPLDKRKEGAPHVSNLASRPCRQPVVLLEWLTSRSATLPVPLQRRLAVPARPVVSPQLGGVEVPLGLPGAYCDYRSQPLPQV